MNKHELTDGELEQLHMEWMERKHGREIQSFIRIANLWYYAAGILNEQGDANGAG